MVSFVGSIVPLLHVFYPALYSDFAFTIVIDYLAGILIERSDGKVRRTYLMLSLIANIGVLAVFKYYNFAAASITEIANWLSWVLHRRCSTAFFPSA
jgi:alginate O-acetyltransferase complex protein AlgI